MPDGREEDERRRQAEAVLAGKGPLRIHMIAIGGTGMAPLACLLRGLGHDVVGSDLPVYPPMSDLLAEAGIEPMVGFDAAHLEERPPDLVVVGNAVPRHNVEAVAAEELELPRISMPEAVGHFLLSGRRPLVVTGTHGKTTTSTMAAWVFRECGLDPGFLVGGAPLGLPGSFCVGSGAPFVVEGDEYNAAYFDRGPKFLHYRPRTAVVTSVEYDHVDLYPDEASFRGAFARLVAELPAEGLLIACWDTAEVRELTASARCRVVGYSADPPLQSAAGSAGAERVVRPSAEPESDQGGTRFRIEHGDRTVEVSLRLWGRHNVANALAVWIAAVEEGLDPEQVASALSSFAGVRRRLEVLGEADGVTVVDDFAHHPTEVAASLRALRQRFGDRRLVALFEPRSLSACRSAFADAYLDAFAPADRVLLAPVFHADRLGEEERLDLSSLCRDLGSRGVEAVAFDGIEELLGAAQRELRPGDVAVTMSSGAFGRAPHVLYSALRSRGR